MRISIFVAWVFAILSIYGCENNPTGSSFKQLDTFALSQMREFDLYNYCFGACFASGPNDCSKVEGALSLFFNKYPDSMYIDLVKKSQMRLFHAQNKEENAFLNDIKSFYARNEFIKTEVAVSYYLEKFPDSNQIDEAKLLSVRARKQNLGKWEIKHFADKFGEKTKERFATHSDPIMGTFSNTATHGSRLDVRMFIVNEHDIWFRLFEYGGSNPVKVTKEEQYKVGMWDKDDSHYSLTAINWADSLCFYGDSKKIHKALLKGGSIKFIIRPERYPRTEYIFKIDNLEHYENALGKLSEKI